MWILLIIIFSQPYHVATVGILGTYSEKIACINEQKRAMTLPVPQKTSFGCIKIVSIKTISHETKGDNHVDINYDYIYRHRQYYQSNGGLRVLR
jgi:hypothetical protein